MNCDFIKSLIRAEFKLERPAIRQTDVDTVASLGAPSGSPIRKLSSMPQIKSETIGLPNFVHRNLSHSGINCYVAVTAVVAQVHSWKRSACVLTRTVSDRGLQELETLH